MDIGCGGCADHPLLMDYFKKKGVELTLIGIDVNRKLLQLTKAGLVTYPLELDMEVDEEGRLSFDRYFGSYKRSDRAAFPNSLLDYFIKWDSQQKTNVNHLHIDNDVNKKGGRWIMRQEYRSNLNLLHADAVQLPFADNLADIVIAENFLMGSKEGVYGRIYDEMLRILKPNGLLLPERP